MHSIKGVDQSCACCGCLCFLPTYVKTMISYAMSDRQFSTIKNRIVLCNSFFGLDKLVALPPNVTLTGSLIAQEGDL